MLRRLFATSLTEPSRINIAETPQRKLRYNLNLEELSPQIYLRIPKDNNNYRIYTCLYEALFILNVLFLEVRGVQEDTDPSHCFLISCREAMDAILPCSDPLCCGVSDGK